MKRTFSTELAYVFGIVFVALGVVLMEKADFGASMVVAPAYLLYRWLSPVWSFVTFGMAEYCLQAVLLLAMCLLLRFRVSYLFSFVTAVVYGFALDAFMLLGAALPAGSVWLRVIYYALGMFFARPVFPPCSTPIASTSGVRTHGQNARFSPAGRLHISTFGRLPNPA